MEYALYLLALTSVVITLFANIYITIVYNRYKQEVNKIGLTGKEVARIILDKNNLKDVKINKVKGSLTDHYNPSTKQVNLSNDVYELSSISAVAVASHECGHALQDKDNYSFMIIRSKLVPFVRFSSKFGYLAILIGALNELKNLNLIEEDEKQDAKKVLKAAAFTYVASVLTTMIEILRLLLIFTKRDD